MLTLPTVLEYDQFVFANYLSVLLYIEDQLNKVATLDEDLEQLKSDSIPFEMRMIITYRSEKKKIIQSQINIIMKTLDVLTSVKDVLYSTTDTGEQSTRYTELLLK